MGRVQEGEKADGAVAVVVTTPGTRATVGMAVVGLLEVEKEVTGPEAEEVPWISSCRSRKTGLGVSGRRR